eukprot:bmy_05609T0
MAAQIGVSQSEPGEKGIHTVIEGLSLLKCRSPRIVRRASMWGQPSTGCQVPNVSASSIMAKRGGPPARPPPSRPCRKSRLARRGRPPLGPAPGSRRRLAARRREPWAATAGPRRGTTSRPAETGGPAREAGLGARGGERRRPAGLPPRDPEGAAPPLVGVVVRPWLGGPRLMRGASRGQGWSARGGVRVRPPASRRVGRRSGRAGGAGRASEACPGSRPGRAVSNQASACRCHGAGAGAGARPVRQGGPRSQGHRGGRGRGRFIGATTPPSQGMLCFPRQGLEEAPGVPWDLCLPPCRLDRSSTKRPGAFWPPWFAPFFAPTLLLGEAKGCGCRAAHNLMGIEWVMAGPETMNINHCLSALLLLRIPAFPPGQKCSAWTHSEKPASLDMNEDLPQTGKERLSWSFTTLASRQS